MTQEELWLNIVIQALPSTFIIDKEGYIVQYIPGAMEKSTMEGLIDSVK